jgi:hypothetical protein
MKIIATTTLALALTLSLPVWACGPYGPPPPEDDAAAAVWTELSERDLDRFVAGVDVRLDSPERGVATIRHRGAARALKVGVVKRQGRWRVVPLARSA